MTEKELIQALKDNEKPYCLMTSDMKRLAEKIRKEKLATSDFLMMNISGVFLLNANLNEFCLRDTYRLRPNYEPPEDKAGVECEVYVSEKGYLHYRTAGHKPVLSKAIDNPDFIGFKYEWTDGARISTAPRLYYGDGMFSEMLRFSNLEAIEVLTPTHVLFRSKP